MLGKTHVVVGMSLYLTVAHPADLKSLLVGTAVSVIGAEISDIDEANSKVRKLFNRIVTCLVFIAVALIFAVKQFGLQIRPPACLETSKDLVAVLLLILIYGCVSNHRDAMHSILIGFVLSVIIKVWIGEYGLYFFISFLSHILLDALNNKSVRLFFPLKKGVCLGICKANGLVNNIILTVGTVYAGYQFYQYFIRFLNF